VAFTSAGMVSSIAISSTSLGFVTTASSQPNDVKRIFPPSIFSQVSVPLSAFFKISCVFHGGPWSQNSPIDENGEGLSTALHCDTAAVDAPYLGGDALLPVPFGAQHDVVREPPQVTGEVMPNSAKGPNAARLHLFDWIDRVSQPDRCDFGRKCRILCQGGWSRNHSVTLLNLAVTA
jgi:hypothetical protein